MKAKITKPMRVNLLSGEVEITEMEYERLRLLNAVELIDEKKTAKAEEKVIPEQKKETRKTKK